MLSARTNIGKDRWLRQFNDLGELVRWIDDTPCVWSTRASREAEYGPGWTLGANYGQCLKLAAEGWHEGVKQLDALASPLTSARLSTMRYDVAGERPDINRFVAGDPFNMVRRGAREKARPILTIAVNIRTSSSIGGQEMANYGAALVTLVDRLENAGRRVELIGLCSTNNSGGLRNGRWAVSWTVKRAQDHLDLAAIAFSMAHPAMWRRLGFAAMERSDKERQCYGYGVEGGITRHDFIEIAEDALLIEGVDHKPGAARTMQGALALATKQINDAAGEEIVNFGEVVNA